MNAGPKQESQSVLGEDVTALSREDPCDAAFVEYDAGLRKDLDLLQGLARQQNLGFGAEGSIWPWKTLSRWARHREAP